MSDGAQDPTTGDGAGELGAKIVPVLLVAALIGVVAALAASLFVWVEGSLQELVWTEIPTALGLGSDAWWYLVIALVVGAAVVMVARRLPGATGGGPLEGFHFDTGPGTIASVLVAALGTLVFGFALGPEAPLIACGTAVGGLLMRGRGPQAVQLGMLLGGVAGIVAIFGNPLITAFMVLEFAALGTLPAAALPPVLVALGFGYIVQVGLGPWSGLGTHSLSVTGVPAFPGLTALEFVGAVVVGVLATALALAARELGERVRDVAVKRPTAALFAAALVTAAVAVAAGALTGTGYTTVLFSGQEAMPTVLGLTSIGALVIIAIAKTIAYAVALGGGFRGGPIFPAVFLGLTVGTAAAVVVPSLTVAGMAATGIAATVAAMTRLPFTGTMLGVLLLASAGGAVTPLAIIGAMLGFLARLALDRLDAQRVERSTPATA